MLSSCHSPGISRDLVKDTHSLQAVSTETKQRNHVYSMAEVSVVSMMLENYDRGVALLMKKPNDLRASEKSARE